MARTPIVYGYTMEDIALTCGIPVAAVRKWHSRELFDPDSLESVISICLKNATFDRRLRWLEFALAKTGELAPPNTDTNKKRRILAGEE